MDGACFAAGMVARVVFFQGGERAWAEAGVSGNLVKFVWFVEIDSRGFFFRKLWVVCSEERM
jgi:hypothetical protein